MYGDVNDSPRERFIAQFDLDDAEPIYRADRVGPAYRVTLDQYHQFLDDHERRTRLIFWGVPLSMLLFGAAIWFVDADLSARLAPYSSFVGPIILIVIVALRWCFFRWSKLAPARALRGTTPRAPALAGDERTARTIGERSWADLWADAFWCALLIVVGTLLFDPFKGLVGWLVFGGCTAILAWTLVQIGRRALFDRRQRRAGVPALL